MEGFTDFLSVVINIFIPKVVHCCLMINILRNSQDGKYFKLMITIYLSNRQVTDNNCNYSNT